MTKLYPGCPRVSALSRNQRLALSILCIPADNLIRFVTPDWFLTCFQHVSHVYLRVLLRVKMT